MTLAVEDVLKTSKEELRSVQKERTQLEKQLGDVQKQEAELALREEELLQRVEVLSRLVRVGRGRKSVESQAKVINKTKARVAKRSKSTSKTDEKATGWAAMSRTDAICAVLEKASAPMDRVAIQETLHKHGRDDQIRDISATLSYLARTGKVHNQAYGQWIWAGTAQTAA